MSYEFKLECNGNEDDLFELRDLIQEERIKDLKVEQEMAPINKGSMGADIIPLLTVVLGSPAIGVAITGIFNSIKTYLEMKPKSQVCLKNGDVEIVFNTETVKNPDKLISEFIKKVK